MRKKVINIYRLGIKELQSLWQDKIMIALIIFSFTFSIYLKASSGNSELNKVPIAFVDNDRSVLSARILSSFYLPRFIPAKLIDSDEVDPGMDAGKYTFVITIPSSFEKDVLEGKYPELQLNIDATRMSQAGIGAGYIQQIINGEVSTFLQQHSKQVQVPLQLQTRIKFNPTLDGTWFGGLMEVISKISLLSIMLSGAALIREREHGTLEHLMVMPLNATEIMLSKVWSMALVVLVSTAFALRVMIEEVLNIPVIGSEILFLFGAFLMLFATTSMGILMGTLARTMPQLGLIIIITILPLQVLSGNVTPFESMPHWLQNVMLLMPTSHFVSMAQAILYRGAGLDIVWPSMVAIVAIGAVYFSIALLLFRKSLSSAT